MLGIMAGPSSKCLPSPEPSSSSPANLCWTCCPPLDVCSVSFHLLFSPRARAPLTREWDHQATAALPPPAGRHRDDSSGLFCRVFLMIQLSQLLPRLITCVPLGNETGFVWLMPVMLPLLYIL